MKRRILALLLAALMLPGLLSVRTWAQEPDTPDAQSAQEEPAQAAESLLTELRLSSGSKWALSNHFMEAADFSPATRQYTLTVDDIYERLYAWVTAAEGATITAVAADGSETTIPSGVTDGTQLAGALCAGAETQTLTIRATAGEGDTQHEDYTITLQKRLTLAEITLTVDGKTADLWQVEDGQMTEADFDSEICSYQAIVPGGADVSMAVTVPFAGYTVHLNGKEYTPEDGMCTIPLALGSSAEETFTLTAYSAENPDAEATAYTVTLIRSDIVPTTITAVDAQGMRLPGALAVVYDSGYSRIWPDEAGTFHLTDGIDYTYVVTCAGYVGAAQTFTAGADNAALTVTLAPVQSVTHGAGVTSIWPSFRGNNDANGVVTAKTPISRETAVLSWANKLGDGYDKNAVCSPILISEAGVDYLIVYSGTTLYKVEAVTGTVVATGTMYCNSTFAINSATCDNGMLFVALSANGKGIVQAFDAATLESLWIYQDPLGDQANCPLVCHNGCVYTGFWRSETASANYVCLLAADEDPARPNESKQARWTYTAPGGFYWAGAYVCDDYLLVGTDDGTSGYTADAALLCLDPDTGAVLDRLDGLCGDIRSSIAHSGDRFYFTSKGGYFYSVSMAGTAIDRSSLRAVKLENGTDNVPMSTCTPVVYNGRAYIGVSGRSQFATYSGHNITVIDLTEWKIAYTVPTMGYPQTSGLLSSGWEDGSVYVYFFDNYTPGKLRMLKDKPGQTAAELVTEENGQTAAYMLFTPADELSQYCICSPVADRYGTIYFKNDSARLMALTNSIDKITVTKQPDKTSYNAGERFDPTGMELTVTYTNGASRTLPASRTINGVTVQYFTWDETVTDGDFILSYVPVLYRSDDEGEAVSVTATVTLSLTVTHLKGDVNGDGAVDVYDLQRLYEHCSGLDPLDDAAQSLADLNGDGDVTATDMQALYAWLTTGAWEAEAAE